MVAEVAQTGESNLLALGQIEPGHRVSHPRRALHLTWLTSQCPTCRADVTVSLGDMSASTTLTPVVDAQTNASGATPTADYGATGTVEAGPDARPNDSSWRAWLGGLGGRAVAQAGAAVTSVNDRLRAALNGGGDRPAQPSDERTPLRPTNV